METLGIVGIALGSTGMSFAMIAWGQIAGVKKELDDLKRNLEEAGVVKKPPVAEE